MIEQYVIYCNGITFKLKKKVSSLTYQDSYEREQFHSTKRVSSSLYLLIFSFLAFIGLVDGNSSYMIIRFVTELNLLSMEQIYDNYFLFQTVIPITAVLSLKLSFYSILFFQNRRHLLNIRKRRRFPKYSLLDIATSLWVVGALGSLSGRLLSIFVPAFMELELSEILSNLEALVENPTSFLFFLISSLSSIIFDPFIPILIILIQIALTGHIFSEHDLSNCRNVPHKIIFIYIFLITFFNFLIFYFIPLYANSIIFQSIQDYQNEIAILVVSILNIIVALLTLFLYILLFILVQKYVNKQRELEYRLKYSLKSTFYFLLLAGALGGLLPLVLMFILTLPTIGEPLIGEFSFFISLIFALVTLLIYIIELTLIPLLIIIFQLAKMISFESQFVLLIPENI
jgi:hypothetical protein